MNKSDTRWQVFPRVVPAGIPVRFTWTLAEGADFPFSEDGTCRMTSLAMQNGRGFRQSREPVSVDAASRTVTATCVLEGEQEHILYLHEGPLDYERPKAHAYVYALAEDLAGLTPYKGDIHMHSDRSDGQDPPAHVAAACRRIGLDFMALTDHGRYAPSGEAQEAFAGSGADLRIYRGEEVHPPASPVHIIHFGGDHSVNDLFLDRDYPRWVAEVDARTGELPADVDRYEYASAVWAFDEIRRAGGLGVFCHPYWVCIETEGTQGYYVSEGLTTAMLDQRPFDAFELLGGYHLHEADSNVLQVARYNEERARGRDVPIVGVSDAHGCETGHLFGWYYTVVFARSPDLPDLIGAIKGLRSVAVEAIAGEVPRVYGPFRLVRYALFLLQRVFPEHDRMCAEEGRLMMAHAAGDADATAALQACGGRTARYMDRILGR